MKQIWLCSGDTIDEGGARGFDPTEVGADTIFVVRWEASLHGWRNSCPHLDVPMHYRKDRFMSADGQRIVCYAHGAQFRPDDGLCVLGPCQGQSLQPVVLRVDDKGDVWLLQGVGTR